jgi:hypothetical protein
LRKKCSFSLFVMAMERASREIVKSIMGVRVLEEGDLDFSASHKNSQDSSQ